MLNFVCVEREGRKFALEMPHIMYCKMAKSYLVKWSEMKKLVNDVYEKKYDHDVSERERIISENRFAMNGLILYSVLSLEAYINYYREKYRVSYGNESFELSTLKKWMIYVERKLGKRLNKKIYNEIRTLFKIRNKLVYPESDLIVIGEGIGKGGYGVQAQVEKINKWEFILGINRIYEEIIKVDKDEAILYSKDKWLCKIEKI